MTFMYRIHSHEYVDAHFAKVTFKCIGYPTEGVHPNSWEYNLAVPIKKLQEYPIGKMVRVGVVDVT
jgi:hypothetical protein